MLEDQPSSAPTRKSMTTAVAGALPLPFVLPAIQEAWETIPDSVPVLSGEQVSTFLTILIAAWISNALGGLLPAWFVRDQWGNPHLDERDMS
jgi:hypothetical protein